MAPIERLVELIDPVVTGCELELWDVELVTGSLRVLVDRPGGIDLDGLSAVTRALSGVLDDHDDLVPEGRYQLEVSSPGIERVLRRPDHYRHQIGSTVALKTRSRTGTAGSRIDGILVKADDEAVWVRVDGAGASKSTSLDTEEVRVEYEEVLQARTVLVWGPEPKPGKTAKQDRAARPDAAQRTDNHTTSGKASRPTKSSRRPARGDAIDSSTAIPAANSKDTPA